MLSSLVTLQNQLEKAKERLKDVEDTIRKSTGRIFNLNNTNRQAFKRSSRHFEEAEGGQSGIVLPFKKRISSDIKGRLGDWVTDDRPAGGKAGRMSGSGFQPGGFMRSNSGRIVTRPYSTQQSWQQEKVEDLPRIPARKRLDNPPNSGQPAVTVFSRLSGPPKDEEVEKIKMTSQVLVQETPSRKEILAAQNKDKSCKERNRRMFGALLGTLQKFRQEETKLKEKEEKKAQVERKVEEAAEREKEEAMKARRELFTSRRQEQINIKHLEFKLTKLKQLSEWEANKSMLMPFIQSEAEPKIFYLPKKHNAKTKKLLENHQNTIKKAIEKKRSEIEQMIEDHIPATQDKRDDEEDIAMNDGENMDVTREEDEAPLMPTAVIKRERDTSSDSGSDDEKSRGSSRSVENDKSRVGSSRSSSDRDEPSIKTEKDDRVVSDKENREKSSPDESSEINVKMEAT